MAIAEIPLNSTPRCGLTDDELATMPTVYCAGLMDGKNVLISGGGSGMGRAMAFLFARLGANVIICGRTQEKLSSTAQAIKERLGKDIHTMAMSIRDPDTVEALLDMVFERFGKLDCLINNAGGQYPQDAIDFTRNGWLAVVDTNLNGPWWMMQSAARRWKDSNSPGNIINIVANVERGIPQTAHTCAARAGVIYLSKSLSTEWAPLKIRINCIAPGATDTEGLRVYPEEAIAHFYEANPMKALGTGWDIAQAAVYFAAPTARFITGELLTLDGGQQQLGVVWANGVPDYYRGYL
jgi:citronellol/citronellal dehydrogenase